MEVLVTVTEALPALEPDLRLARAALEQLDNPGKAPRRKGKEKEPARAGAESKGQQAVQGPKPATGKDPGGSTPPSALKGSSRQAPESATELSEFASDAGNAAQPKGPSPASPPPAKADKAASPAAGGALPLLPPLVSVVGSPDAAR
jgi:hypothetical protein